MQGIVVLDAEWIIRPLMLGSGEMKTENTLENTRESTRRGTESRGIDYADK